MEVVVNKCLDMTELFYSTKEDYVVDYILRKFILLENAKRIILRINYFHYSSLNMYKNMYKCINVVLDFLNYY